MSGQPMYGAPPVCPAPAAGAAAFCPSCGTPFQAGSKFCSACGARGAP